jgi:hypothetical protein
VTAHQSAKRSKIPTVLSVEEIQRLFSCIKEPCRTAVILDAVSGLRVGELLRLKWEDVRFDQLELNVTRSVSRQVVTPCKTEVSRKPIPMNPEIADMLGKWRLEAPYNKPDDWIFCESAQERNPTLLAWVAVPSARETGASESGYFCISRMAHTTAQLWNLDENQWRGPQDHPRTAAPCNVQSHSGYLHASGHACETRRANQNREANFGRRSRIEARHADDPVAYWTLMDPDSKQGFRVSSLESWRPRRDLNPCYRRERAMS